MLFSPVPFYNPISHPTPPQRTCIYKLLSIIRLAFSPTPISLISFRSDCLCLFLLQAPHRSLHHGLFPKLSFHFLSSCFSHFSRSSLLQCSIFSLPGTAFLCFCFDQQTAFAIFYAFPTAWDIACDNGAAGCCGFQEDVAHAFMIAGKNDTVCFCIKWARV